MENIFTLIIVIIILLIFFVVLGRGSGFLYEMALQQGFVGLAALIALWACLTPLMFGLSLLFGACIIFEEIRDKFFNNSYDESLTNETRPDAYR